MTPDQNSTVHEARRYVYENAGEGTSCPCCGQMVKRYKRKLYGAMIERLARAYNRFGMAPFHLMRDFNGEHPGDFAKLRYWGMIEEQANTNTNKRTSGYWRVLPLGREFLAGRASVFSDADVLLGDLVGLSGTMVTVSDVMGETFNFKELMA